MELDKMAREKAQDWHPQEPIAEELYYRNRVLLRMDEHRTKRLPKDVMTERRQQIIRTSKPIRG